MAAQNQQAVSDILAGIQPGDGYGGEVDVKGTWDILDSVDNAVLIDVRTNAEWAFVGMPDLASLGKELALVPWQIFPEMHRNGDFEQQVSSVEADRSAPLLFLCRSGVRSKAAAIAMTKAGYGHCYNVTGGFEGDKDNNNHRGTKNGWKAADLPWVQQ